MTRTRKHLLENFDDEVREKLRMHDEASRAYLNQYERRLMQLTRHELDGHAEFTDDSSFRLKSCPFAEIGNAVPLGLYELPRRSGEAHLYRMGHPLAEAVLTQAKARELPHTEVCFDYAEHKGKVSIVEPLLGQSGWLMLSQLSIESLDRRRLLLLLLSQTRRSLDEEVANLLRAASRTAAAAQGIWPLVAAVGTSGAFTDHFGAQCTIL